MKWLLFIISFNYSFGTQSAPHLERQWSRTTLSTSHLGFRYLNRMPPLLAGDFIIQGNAVDGISAYDRNSGNKKWEMTLKNGVEGGAALDENRLYFGANNGKFYCVDALSGKVLWTFKLNSESLTQPLVHGDFVYHVAGNNTLYSLNKKTGETVWVKTNSAKANMTVRGQTAPVYESGILYVGSSDGGFVAVNAQNGRELWSKRIGDDKKFNDVDARVVLSQHCLLVSSYANALYCLDRDNGTIKWRHDFGGYNAVLVIEDKVYFPTVDNEIHVLDEDSGKLLKKVINLEGMATEIVRLDNFLVYGESQGSLVLREISTLNKALEFDSGLGVFARPTVDTDKNQIYLISNDANLYRLDLTQRPSNAFQWSISQ